MKLEHWRAVLPKRRRSSAGGEVVHVLTSLRMTVQSTLLALKMVCCISAHQSTRTISGELFRPQRAVQQVSWSPFAKNVFISASSDWTIKLWREDSEVPVLSMQSGSEHVSDVCWSPKNSTVFATASWNGQLDVWDLSVSTLKPVLSTSASDKKLSCVLFSQTSPVVVAGGCDGRVGVYRLVGLNDRAPTREKDLTRPCQIPIEIPLVYTLRSRNRTCYVGLALRFPLSPHTFSPCHR